MSLPRDDGSPNSLDSDASHEGNGNLRHFPSKFSPNDVPDILPYADFSALFRPSDLRLQGWERMCYRLSVRFFDGAH